MHEMSVALEVCRVAERHVGVEGAPLLSRVTLLVGDDAGLEPANLEFCLDTLLKQPPFAGAAVEIKRAPGDVLRVESLEVDDARSSH